MRFMAHCRGRILRGWGFMKLDPVPSYLGILFIGQGALTRATLSDEPSISLTTRPSSCDGGVYSLPHRFVGAPVVAHLPLLRIRETNIHGQPASAPLASRWAPDLILVR
jgi:hypothetical protein